MSANNPGLEVLIEYGALRARTVNPKNKARDAIINCIGCQLANPEVDDTSVNATEITKCNYDVDRSEVSVNLRRLERARVLDASSPNRHGKPIYYTIAETAVGQAFREAVQPPAVCPSNPTIQA